MNFLSNNQIRTYQDALPFHRSMTAMQTAVKNSGVTPAPDFEAVWESITTMRANPVGSFEAEIDNAMPVQVIPIVRADSEVAAVFAYCAILAGWLKSPNDYPRAAKFGWDEFEKRRQLANKLSAGYPFGAGSDDPSWECAVMLHGQPDVAIVEEIAKMAGQMFQALGSVRTTPSGDPEDVTGAQMGGDIERLFTEEFVQLVDPMTTDQAAIKILEDRATEYEMTGAMRAQAGPLVILIDESGSMTDGGAGSTRNRNTWAKAAAVAMTRVAHGENRMVSVVHFATSCVVKRLPPGDHKAVLEMSRHFLDGGTAIAAALAIGVKEVQQLAQDGHAGADLVIITDGEDGDHVGQEAVLQMGLAAANTRLWTVAIECRLAPNAPIVKYASKVIRVAQSQEADMVADLRDAAIGQQGSLLTSGADPDDAYGGSSGEDWVKGLLN